MRSAWPGGKKLTPLNPPYKGGSKSSDLPPYEEISPYEGGSRRNGLPLRKEAPPSRVGKGAGGLGKNRVQQHPHWSTSYLTENDKVFSGWDGVLARIVAACRENIVDALVFCQG